MNIGQRIKQRREELHMTQSELALKVDYTTRSAISMIEKENRDMPLSQLKKFAKALDCDPMWLMYGNNTEVTETAIEDARLVAKYRALLPEDRLIIDSLLDSLYAKAQKRTP